MLAQAIVNKTLDMERQRQAEIRKRLDRISKIELVKKVRVSLLLQRYVYFYLVSYNKSVHNPVCYLYVCKLANRSV